MFRERILPFLKRIEFLLPHFGIHPHRLVRSLQYLPGYLRDMHAFNALRASSPVPFAKGKLFPCLTDKRAAAGDEKGHYFHQDYWVARQIFQNNPLKHLDIGSRIDGFITHVAVFRKVEILDIRPVVIKGIPNLKVTQVDLMSPLPAEFVACCDSMSCLHTLEHFGLGRYGDPLNFLGYLDGLRNIHTMLAPNGRFYFSTPIGPQRVEFNAHRVFSTQYLWDILLPDYSVDAFAYVDDAGQIHDVDLAASDTALRITQNFGCNLGCGIFALTKR